MGDTTDRSLSGASGSSAANSNHNSTSVPEGDNRTSSDRAQGLPVTPVMTPLGSRVFSSFRSFIFRHRRFLLVLIVGGLLQFLVTFYWPSQLDEGEYLQAAILIVHGGVPMVTFAGREPLLMYYLAAGILLFGPSLTVARGMIVVANLVTAGSIYLVARRLLSVEGELVGILAAGAYLMSPYGLFFDTIVWEEPFCATFLSVGLLFLLRDRWKASEWNLVLAGIAVGLAVLARRSAALAGLLFLAFVILTRAGLKERVSAGLRLAAPAVLIVGGLSLYVAFRTSLPWTITELGVGSLHYGQVAFPLSQRLEVFGYGMITGAGFFLVPWVLPVRWLSAVRYRVLAVVGTSFLIGLSVWEYPRLSTVQLAEISFSPVVMFLGLVALFWVAVLLRELLAEPRLSTGTGPLLGGVLAWAGGIFLADFAARPIYLATYLTDLVAPLSILFGIWAAQLFVSHPRNLSEGPSRPTGVGGRAEEDTPDLHRRNLRRASGHTPPGLRRPALRAVLSALAWVTLLVLSSLVATVIFGPANHSNIERTYSPALVASVAAYVDRHLGPHQAVFSFDDELLAAAGRTNTPSIVVDTEVYQNYLLSHAPVNASPYPNAPRGFAPSLQQLLDLWNRTPLLCVVDGVRTQLAERSSPLLNWYFNTEFHPVATFGDPQYYGQIFVLWRGPPPSNQLTSVTKVHVGNRPVDLAYDSRNDTIYAGSLNSSKVAVISKGHLTGYLNPPGIQGVNSLAWLNSGLWIGSSLTPNVTVLFDQGGPPQTIQVGSGPSAFATDPSSGLVFVSTWTSGKVYALSRGVQNGTWYVVWVASVGPKLTGLAVDPATNALYVASAGGSFIEQLSERNGSSVNFFRTAYPPFTLIFASNTLIATWWEGVVFQVNLHNGTILSSVQVGSGVYDAYYDPASGLLAVPSYNYGTVSLLLPKTLMKVGVISGAGCAEDVILRANTNWMASADTCSGNITVGELPPRVKVTVSGALGSQVTLQGVDIGPRGTFDLYPQVIAFSSHLSGYYGGFLLTTIESGNASLGLTVALGPSMAALNLTLSVYDGVVTGAAMILGGVGLFAIYRSEIPARRSGKPEGPPRD